MKKQIYLTIIVLFILAVSCKKNKSCVTPPEKLSFNFITTDSADAFNNGLYSFDSLKIFYLDSGAKTNLNFDTISSVYANKRFYIFTSTLLNEKAWQENKTTTFLFQFKSNKVDTLSTHCIKIFNNECTFFQYDTIKYNGSKVEKTINGQQPLKYSYQITIL